MNKLLIAVCAGVTLVTGVSAANAQYPIRSNCGGAGEPACESVESRRAREAADRARRENPGAGERPESRRDSTGGPRTAPSRDNSDRGTATPA